MGIVNKIRPLSALGAINSRHRVWFLSGLQWQIITALALGLVVIFGVFSAIAYNTINQSTNAALNERKALAALSAQAIDNLVAHATEQMESISGIPILWQGGPDEIKAALEDLHSSLDTFERLSLVDLSAADMWTAPNGDLTQATSWLSSPQVAAAVDTGTTQVFPTPPSHLESGHPALCIIAARVGPAGFNHRRVLVGELHLREGDRGLVPLPHFSPTSGTTIIDDQGRVLASSNGNITQITQEHFPLLPDFLSDNRSGVAIHRPPEGKSHVVAFAPFHAIPGGVIVEEREDVVLAVSQNLRRNLVLFGTLGLALTSVVAWLHVRRTMRPIRRLTSASKAIAEGVLDQPVEIQRNDEIGVLARSFETMRQKLLEAERQRVRWEQEMEEQVKQRTEQVHTLLGRVISAQEEERKRVARELHDEVAQELATLLITLLRLSQSPASLQEADRNTLVQAQNQLSSTLKEMRRMISDLRPSALDDLGLEAAIRSYAESRAEAVGLRVHFETVGAVPAMDGVRQTALFRILQEATNNAVRHAHAGNLWIRLEFSKEGVNAAIEDDGKGFDVASAARDGDSASQLGIMGMKERAALLNGKVEVDSRSGHGTRVLAWIPLSA
ncbi:MAG: HAMP domain-containing protein [Dehalococcoidia bacterium]